MNFKTIVLEIYFRVENIQNIDFRVSFLETVIMPDVITFTQTLKTTYKTR